ncbi:MAG: RDD family protein [Mariprofundaceae bacterium]|nr:RDD family protein [Mariprofundaceae bacterium]
MAKKSKTTATKASVTARVVAGLYDLIIFIGVGMIAFIPISILKELNVEIPDWMSTFVFCSVAYAYFAGFWVKGQATTGMRPWKLRVVHQVTGEALSFQMATVRFIIFGLVWLSLGYVMLCIRDANITGWDFALAAVIPFISLLCMAFTRQRQALHDLLSESCVYKVVE